VADIGPGLGETTEWLARDLTPARLLALDIAPAMLTAVRDRLGTAAELVRADFNALPLADQRFDLAVLWFCVYHSSHPDQVLAEVRRILRPGALALFATKGPQSYASMDELVRRAGLDDNPRDRPSLYRTFNSHNFLDVVGQALDVVTVHHVDHEFVFDDPAALARYVVTSPRYSTYQQIPLAQVERRLAAVWPGQRFHTYSRLSYCAGRRGT
jgi:SAM-dependent methyltransferase